MNTPWRPPGLPCPWPEDEYICDGGVTDSGVSVATDWTVHGLKAEDAVAHYDTVDGVTLVEPSNRVCLYAPRFAAVRQVVSAVAGEQHDHALGVSKPVQPQQQDESVPALAAKQQVQPRGELAAKPPVAMISKQGDGAMSSAVKARAFQDALLPYEDLAIIRAGIMEMSEMAVLARGVQNAITWTSTQAVQVILDRKAAAELAHDQNAPAVYAVEEPPPCPRLRLIKIASTPMAEPGDEVSFTLRFDNVGNQPIGNVTVLDSLSPRLEYVEQSAQCSLPAEFSTQPNEKGSVVVRCEVANPLKPGEGGIIRFTCKVR